MALISDAYRRQNKELHDRMPWYGNGRPQDQVVTIAEKYTDVLDYGCGKGRLTQACPHVKRYDPAIPEFAALPEPADLVICKDVMEHVEPDSINEVLDHIKWLYQKAAYFVISCRPANKLLNDGRNAHISIHPVQWWLDKLKERFKVVSYEIHNAELTVLCE